MKDFFNNKLHPRLVAMALFALLSSKGLHAQQKVTAYMDNTVTVAADPTVRMYVYGDMEMAATAKVHIQDGAKVIFYGDSLRAKPGAEFYGLNTQGTSSTEGVGSGSIAFIALNPVASTSSQQVLVGGNSGSNVHNTFVAIEIDNKDGVKLANSHSRIGGTLTFTNGHLYTDVQNMVMAQNASIAGANENKFVVTDNGGFLAKEAVGASNNGFPVGSSDHASDYLPAILNNAGTPDRYNVRAIGSLTPAPASGASSMLKRSWQITEAVAGGGNVFLALQHDIATTQGSAYSDATARILASAATASWQVASTTSPSYGPGTTFGSTAHSVAGIGDFTTNTYFTKGLVAKTTPDLYAWFTSANGTFQMSGDDIVNNQNIIVNVGELNGFATTGTVEVRIVKNPGFDMTFDPAATSIDVGVPKTVNNANWTMTTTAGYYSFKTARPIAANGQSKIGLNFKVKSGVTSSANSTISGTIVNGSGGELTSDNGNNAVSLLVSILF